jgi:uroporphyrinogen-III synthase
VSIPVWFTRPLSDSEVTTIRDQGLEPVVHPLISIRIFPVREILASTKTLPKPDAIAFTSKNAVDAFLTCKVIEPDLLDGVRIFCLGDATAKRFSEAGYSVTISADPTGVGLAKRMASELPKNSIIWHFCSTIKRAETGETLTAAGLKYFPVECYETIERVHAGIPEEPFKAVVFYSPSAVRAFAASKEAKKVTAKIIAIGETTAHELNSFGFQDIIIPENPSTMSIIQLISQMITKG